MSWSELQSLVGTVWVPGGNAPFDPVATQYASKIRLKVIVASGNNSENFMNILNGRRFFGTVIGPD